jgi:CDP-diacylglycerol--glycerol-3-phosphate 3-phosphatidyltransferase
LYTHYASLESKSILDGNDTVIYGSSWSFMRYVTDTYGQSEGGFLGSINKVQNDHGVANVVSKSGKPFSELFGMFSIASLADNYPDVNLTDPKLRLASWNSRNLFQRMSTDLVGSDGAPAYPLAWPLRSRNVSFGNFNTAQAEVSQLRGGGFAAWELSGTQTGPQALAIRSTNGGAAPPLIGMAIVRHPVSQSILSTSVRSIPLALTIFRICSAPVLLWLAALGREEVFLWLAIAALLSDVLDGALARRLGAASETGRLLDSWADLLIALVSFAGGYAPLAGHHARGRGLLRSGLAALVIPNAWGLLRYRRLLGYHTLSAKSSGVFLATGTVMLFTGVSPVPFRLASFVEVLVAAEYIAISLILPGWTGEMKSAWHAWRYRQGARGGEPA